MGKRKLSPNELKLAVFPADLDEENRPKKVHVIRKLIGSGGYSKTPCGLGNQLVFSYPFLRWLLENAPLCTECKRAAGAALEGGDAEWFADPSSNTGQNSDQGAGNDAAK